MKYLSLSALLAICAFFAFLTISSRGEAQEKAQIIPSGPIEKTAPNALAPKTDPQTSLAALVANIRSSDSAMSEPELAAVEQNFASFSIFGSIQ
ncbi:MAG: hypothetical protein LBV12_12315 [Puniceicoccales bacterium]|jgi:hypothetical protein|nr:hypothetical protein [Puniceicoccales bacterium]